MEEFENVDPETVTLPAPMRSVRTAIEGRPQIRRYTIEQRSRSHFAVTFHDEGRTVRVPRATPATPPRDAVRLFLSGGAA